MPSYLGVRNVCVKFSDVHLSVTDYYLDDVADEDCMPYLRIFIDNYQVGAFILQRWCARTGQTPHQYQIIERVKDDIVGYTEDIYKCNPLKLEALCEVPTIERIAFGSAAQILCGEVDPMRDLYNIPYVRTSSKFGKKLNTYAIRNIKQREEERQQTELERARIMRKRDAKSYARINNRVSVMRNTYKDVHLAFLGFYTYGRNKQYKQRYAEARYNAVGKLASLDAAELDKRLAAMHAPDILKTIHKADDLITEHRELEAIAKAATQKLRDIEEEQQSNKEKGGEDPVVYPEVKGRPRNNTQAKARIFSSFTMAAEGTAKDRIKPTDVEGAKIDEVADILSHFANIEIDYKTRQIKLKF